MTTDDYDQRFHELMADEFGDESKLGSTYDPSSSSLDLPDPNPTSLPPEPFSFEQALARADGQPDPWDDFVPPVVPKLTRPRNPVSLAGLILLSFALGIAVIAVFVTLPVVVLRIAGGLGVIGLATLLFSLPRTPKNLDDDGICL